MKIDVRIIAPDLVEVTETPSWWERFRGLVDWQRRAGRLPHGWYWALPYWAFPPIERRRVSRGVADAIARAFTDLDARRAAETARNHQAAAQRGEYPIR